MSSGVVERRNSALLLLGLAILVLSGCRSVPPVVKIGLVAPFEGQYRAIGYDVIYSARLAVREVNAAGGIGGYQVVLQALDDGGDSALAREAAASLVVDPAVVVVVGHWLTETTTAALPIYETGDLSLLPAGQPPIGPTAADALPAEFVAAYERVTPFAEVPGPYAATAYDAFQLLFAALREAADSGAVDRSSMAAALATSHADGILGPITAP